MTLRTDAEPVDPAQVAAKVKTNVEELARINFADLDPGTMPELYSSGVLYQKKRQGEFLSSVRVVLLEGHGDVEELVAWRLAELWMLNESAYPVVQWVTRGAGIYMTVLVRRALGRTENVIENLARIPLVTKGSLWINLSSGRKCEVVYLDMMPPEKSLMWRDVDTGPGHGQEDGGELEKFLTTHRPFGAGQPVPARTDSSAEPNPFTPELRQECAESGYASGVRKG